jgi:hypothetical protein
MSEKHLVCQGAICECKFGSTPDQLMVLSQKKHYINDEQGSEKPLGNTMDLGQPFKAKTFGSCKLMNNAKCSPAITAWVKFYENVVLDNGGKLLLENSKGTCAVAGAPCVEFTVHGQTAAVSSQNTKKAEEDSSSYLNPLMNVTKIADKLFRFDLPAAADNL